MSRYLVRRVLIAIPLFFGITMIVFMLFAMSPGDPLINVIGISAYMELSPEEIAQVQHQYGLDRPVYVRYIDWLSGALQGDLGYPLKGPKTVVDLLRDRIPPTLLLMGVSLLLALVIGIPMGIIMALRQYSLIDYALTIVAFVNLSIPPFFVALGFIYIFSLKLDLLPTYGMATIGAPFSITDRLLHLVMPATILGVFHAGEWARYARSSVLEVIRADYVTVARAKGLREKSVIVKHVFRNALLPIITIVGLSVPRLLGGSIIVETVFQWPGMGTLMYKATTTQDYPIVMGVTLMAAVMILVSNLVADVAYAVADPRIRYE